MWLIISAMSITVVHAQGKSKTLLFIGSYTQAMPDTGIYVYTFNVKSGALKQISVVEDITNPSFITLSPDGQYLYACTDTKTPDTGSITSFKVDALQGKLTLINKQSSEGDNPVYLSVHKDNKWIINANYSGGSVSVYTTNADGSLNPSSQVITFAGSSIIEDRQEKPHIHAAVFSPSCDHVFLPDLGADKIWAFAFDTSKSQPLVLMYENIITTVPGSGPRHFAFHPNAKFAYCIEELSGMISVYSFADGRLDSIQRIFSNSKQRDTYWNADIHISPDGRFLYTSNRGEGENTIAIFSIDRTSGMLTLISHQSTYGDHPRNFTIDPTGKFLLVANMVSGNIVVFKRDLKSGLLSRTKNEIQVSFPSCLQMRTYGK